MSKDEEFQKLSEAMHSVITNQSMLKNEVIQQISEQFMLWCVTNSAILHAGLLALEKVQTSDFQRQEG